MDLGLADRAYVVTGGSGGLGLATAAALVADGARVVVSGRSASTVATAVTDLGPDRAVGVVADNAEPGTPARLVQAARSSFGRLDGALVSVGGPPAGSVLDSSDEDWTAAFESVLLGGLRLGRDIGRELGEGGSIAFVLSSPSRRRCPASRSPTGCAPAWRCWPRTWPTSSVRAGCGSTDCCPAGSRPTGCVSSTS